MTDELNLYLLRIEVAGCQLSGLITSRFNYEYRIHLQFLTLTECYL